MKSLAEAGAEVGTTDSSRRTALHLAITSGPYVVEALLPFLKSFPWETKDRDDKTVLQLALAKKDLQSAQLLLDGSPCLVLHLLFFQPAHQWILLAVLSSSKLYTNRTMK